MSAGSLLGILSDRDVLVRATLADDGVVVVPSVRVATAMTLSPVTCDVDATVSSIAAIMIERRLDALPVVSDADRIVGLVTSTDLLALLVVREGARRLPLRFEIRDGSEAEMAA